MAFPAFYLVTWYANLRRVSEYYSYYLLYLLSAIFWIYVLSLLRRRYWIFYLVTLYTFRDSFIVICSLERKQTLLCFLKILNCWRLVYLTKADSYNYYIIVISGLVPIPMKSPTVYRKLIFIRYFIIVSLNCHVPQASLVRILSSYCFSSVPINTNHGGGVVAKFWVTLAGRRLKIR